MCIFSAVERRQGLAAVLSETPATMMRMQHRRQHTSSHDTTGTADTWRPFHYVSYLIVLCSLATVARCGVDDGGSSTSLVVQHPQLSPSTVERKPITRVRRQTFSVIQDLNALAEMLREASRRRQQQNALEFFNGLHRRGRSGAPAATRARGDRVADRADDGGVMGVTGSPPVAQYRTDDDGRSTVLAVTSRD